MAAGDIFTIRIPTDLDYLAAADTVLTNVNTDGFFDPALADNITSTLVDVSGKNTLRKVVVVMTARETV